MNFLQEDDDGTDVLLGQYFINSADNQLFPRLSQEREIHFRTGLREQEWVMLYLDSYFHRIFQMTKDTYNELVRAVAPLYPIKEHRGRALPVNVSNAVLMTIEWLAKHISMEEIGEHFNVTKSTVCSEVWTVIGILNQLSSSFTVWPQESECQVLKDQFYAKAGFPGVIGAIDGCHILVMPPADQVPSYIDRKMNASIILQGICTATKIFTNVSVGVPGCRNDNAALAASAFYRKISTDGTKSLFYDDATHLVGDKAYVSSVVFTAI